MQYAEAEKSLPKAYKLITATPPYNINFTNGKSSLAVWRSLSVLFAGFLIGFNFNVIDGKVKNGTSYHNAYGHLNAKF